MKPILIFLAIIIAFGLSFSKHISMLMYPLSALIFYFYLPVIYASSRINILHHKKNKELFHIKFYPIELGAWLASTLFLAFMLSHLISDLLFDHAEALYHFMIFLISISLAGIFYCERDATRFHLSKKDRIFQIQGRLLSFEILFFMILLFVISH